LGSVDGNAGHVGPQCTIMFIHALERGHCRPTPHE